MLRDVYVLVLSVVVQVAGLQGEEVVAEGAEVEGLGRGLQREGLVVEAHPFEQASATGEEIVRAEGADLGAVERAARVGVEVAGLRIGVDVDLIKPAEFEGRVAVVEVPAAREYLVVPVVVGLVLGGQHVGGLQ